VIDPAHQWVVDGNRLASRSRNTPWEGWKLTGKVRHTIYDGTPTVRNGEATR
jgi:dihydroorotase